MSNRTRIEEQRRGKPIKARTLRNIARILNIGQSPKDVTSGIQATRLKRFQVLSEDGDFLLCSPMVTGQSGTVKVAKPYLLRRTPFDGATRAGISYTYTSDTERTATAGDSETQVINPTYTAGDQIFAHRTLGGSGVTDDDGVAVVWVDNNNDGRAWAKKAE